ncbi:hypothetical protein AB0N05_09485 [Nocardia sp. NPDC051030]|uniref:hypothetical protein n=1 Tax=Nocardia sp. NPDC051030 TaxID=3155162 RepID=UPI0034357F3A
MTRSEPGVRRWRVSPQAIWAKRTQAPLKDPDSVIARRHEGEGIEDGFNVLGIVLIGLGIVALALTLVAGGYGFDGWLAIAGSVCVLLLLAGTGVLLTEWRRRRTRKGMTPDTRQGH